MEPDRLAPIGQGVERHTDLRVRQGVFSGLVVAQPAGSAVFLQRHHGIAVAVHGGPDSAQHSLDLGSRGLDDFRRDVMGCMFGGGYKAIAVDIGPLEPGNNAGAGLKALNQAVAVPV
tara:strand:+ start:12884 stop:13234 length:351 start_codon:yes stop_codon:yes gene_type:complete